MRSHLAAIMALTPTGIAKYDTVVPETPTFPYALFTAPTFREDGDTLDGERTDIDDYLQCTAVGSTVEQARWCQEKMRAALDRATPALDGYVTSLHLRTRGDVHLDETVTLNGSGHPAYSNDSYHYRANGEPADS